MDSDYSTLGQEVDIAGTTADAIVFTLSMLAVKHVGCEVVEHEQLAGMHVAAPVAFGAFYAQSVNATGDTITITATFFFTASTLIWIRWRSL